MHSVRSGGVHCYRFQNNIIFNIKLITISMLLNKFKYVNIPQMRFGFSLRKYNFIAYVAALIPTNLMHFFVCSISAWTSIWDAESWKVQESLD